MKLTIILATYVLIIIAAIIFMWLAAKGALNPEHKHPGRVLIPLIIVTVMGAFPLIGALVPDGPVCWFFQKWGNIFLGLLMYFYLSLFILWIVSLFFILPKNSKEDRKAAAKKWAKALFVLPLIITVAVNVLGFRTSHDVKVTGYELDKSVLGLNEPARIILVGDLHIGVNSTPGLYRDMVERINEQDADLVLIAGDLVTSSFGAMRDPEGYAAIFREIQSKLGVYVVYGNHDVDEPLLGGFTYAGVENAIRNPSMEGWVRDCGWNLLRDETLRIPELNNMVLVGRRDETRPGDGVSERASLEDLTKDCTQEDGVLLLQHEPTDLDDLGELGVDLSVSGHTHDGQIFPGNVFCRIKGPQSYGLKDWGSSKALVTSGTGYYGPPIRVCTISEIVVIDFK